MVQVRSDSLHLDTVCEDRKRETDGSFLLTVVYSLYSAHELPFKTCLSSLPVENIFQTHRPHTVRNTSMNPKYYISM